MAAELEDLIVGALSGEDNEIQLLSNKIKTSDLQELRNAQANFDSMLDTWDEAVSRQESMARLCVELAERDALEAQARELDARGLHGNARAIRSLKNDFYYLVAAACDSMAEQHDLLEAHTNRLQSSGGKDMKNDEQQQ